MSRLRTMAERWSAEPLQPDLEKLLLNRSPEPIGNGLLCGLLGL
jgi:hypothetical protein